MVSTPYNFPHLSPPQTEPQSTLATPREFQISHHPDGIFCHPDKTHPDKVHPDKANPIKFYLWRVLRKKDRERELSWSDAFEWWPIICRLVPFPTTAHPFQPRAHKARLRTLDVLDGSIYYELKSTEISWQVYCGQTCWFSSNNYGLAVLCRGSIFWSAASPFSFNVYWKCE